MESANSYHHHQLQDQLVGSSASSLPTSSSFYGLGFTTTHACPSPPPTSILNTNRFSSCPSETIFNSGEKRQQMEETLLSSHYTSMAPPELALHWAAAPTTNQCAQVLQNSTMKEELAHHYYTQILSNSSQSNTDELSLRRHEQNNIGTRLFLKPFSSSGNLMNNGRGFCSHIFPSINISNLNQTAGFTSPAGSSLDMNLESLDLLASSRFSCTSSQNQIGILRDGLSYSFDHIKQLSHDQIPFYSSKHDKVSSASSHAVVVESKRNSNKMEPKAQLQNAPKKSRIEARSSCPPFKVRKEKLGDRIAALQQLVAPFGKTDTASVLMEAIGYIKFLQNQVETLSVPYMKASRNNPNRLIKGGRGEIENVETKRDLKSRGLCLVPLTCLSYITDSSGAGDVWPTSHFVGANV